METLHIGLLEFGDLAFTDVVDVARLADELGYSRFWLAEHFTARAYTNSLLATPVVAGMTSQIRVGPAGVLLRYSMAAAVARDALFLENGFERVDLGLASGFIPAPYDADFTEAREEARSDERFTLKVEGVAHHLTKGAVAEARPELWLLGGSESPARATLAARIGAHFALSLLHSKVPPSPAPIRAYHEACARLEKEPGVAVVALPIACLASEDERSSYTMPHPGVVVPPFVETAALCRERIEEVCHEYGVREVSILECSPDAERRRASVRLLAEAFGGLAGPPPKGKVPAFSVAT